MASERITLLPDDRALKVLAMRPDLAVGTATTIPDIDPLSAADLDAWAALNRDRCRHLGLDPAAFPVQVPIRKQKVRWELRITSEPALLGGQIRFRVQIQIREPLPEPHLIFAGGLLLHGGIFRQHSANGRHTLLSMRLPQPPAAGTSLMILSRKGLLRHRTGSDFWTIPDQPFETGSEGSGIDLRAEIQAGKFVTKKGNLQSPRFAEAAPKPALAALYARIRVILQARFGYGVMVSHGTLLGLVREGDLIENDDDFDCAYLSAAADCAAVAAEREAIVAALRAEGLSCHYSITGHIKVKSRGAIVDLMPAWFEAGRYNVSGYTSIPLPPEAILPFQEHEFHGIQVLMPARPELFLEGNYGPGWRVPDPFYRSQINPQAMQHRKLLQIVTPQD